MYLQYSNWKETTEKTSRIRNWFVWNFEFDENCHKIMEEKAYFYLKINNENPRWENERYSIEK